jgi:hypothetical protein
MCELTILIPTHRSAGQEEGPSDFKDVLARFRLARKAFPVALPLIGLAVAMMTVLPMFWYVLWIYMANAFFLVVIAFYQLSTDFQRNRVAGIMMPCLRWRKGGAQLTIAATKSGQ